MAATRLTVTLDRDLIARAREASGGNVSRFVSKAILNQLEEERRRKLREDLATGYAEKAEEDLEICREWAGLEAEAAAYIDE